MDEMHLTGFARRALLLSALTWVAMPNAANAQVASAFKERTRTQSQPDLLPISSESYHVDERDWIDKARQRAVPIRVYLPAGIRNKKDGWPLVVFSHGIGGSRRGYNYLGTYLAYQGFIALHVQHVGSDSELWFGNPLKLVDRLQGAAKEVEAIERVSDIRFAIDQFLDSEWGSLADAQKIVAAGHSYGANTMMLLAGARIARNGQDLALRDPRIRAAVIISAPPFYGEANPSSILGGIEIPTLHITATEDVISIPGYFSSAQDRVSVFESMGGPSKVLAVFKGGSHSVFTDRTNTGGLSLNPKLKQATRELVADFITTTFTEANGGLESWQLKHRDLLAQWTQIKKPDEN